MDSMHPDESFLADGAKKRAQEIHKKRSFRVSISVLPSKDTVKRSNSQVPAPTLETEPVLVEFRDKRKNKNDEVKLDQFRWATLYENQRGYVSL